MRNDDKDNLKYAWDVVKRKLLDSLNAIERTGSLGNGIVESKQHAKQPLSLHAIADGPRLRLLWASFQQLEKEAGTVSAISFFSGYFFMYLFCKEILLMSSYWFLKD